MMDSTPDFLSYGSIQDAASARWSFSDEQYRQLGERITKVFSSFLSTDDKSTFNPDVATSVGHSGLIPETITDNTSVASNPIPGTSNTKPTGLETLASEVSAAVSDGDDDDRSDARSMVSALEDPLLGISSSLDRDIPQANDNSGNTRTASCTLERSPGENIHLKNTPTVVDFAGPENAGHGPNPEVSPVTTARPESPKPPKRIQTLRHMRSRGNLKSPDPDLTDSSVSHGIWIDAEKVRSLQETLTTLMSTISQAMSFLNSLFTLGSTSPTSNVSGEGLGPMSGGDVIETNSISDPPQGKSVKFDAAPVVIDSDVQSVSKIPVAPERFTSTAMPAMDPVHLANGPKPLMPVGENTGPSMNENEKIAGIADDKRPDDSRLDGRILKREDPIPENGFRTV